MSDPAAKEACTCRTTCRRRGNSFPSDWAWRCQLLPYEQPHPLARAANDPLRGSTLQALKDLVRGYVNLLETGRDRIMDLGGMCDSVETMERGDRELRQARDAITAAEQAAAAAAREPAQPPQITHIALLEIHGRSSLLHAPDFRAVIVPPGQSLDFDEGPGASRRWLHPYLGKTHHLASFIEVATPTKGDGQ